MTTSVDRLSGIRDGLGLKAPVRAATTANITLSGEQTIDGVAVVADNRVLVKDQDTAADNGIYVVSSGNWTRASDFNGSRDVVQGTGVLIPNGTANANKIFYITTANPIVVGTTSLVFDNIEFDTVPADGSTTTAKLADDAVTYAKMQNVSATSRILGRKTALAGDVEEMTLSETLDFIGSAAEGDILIREAGGWARLPKGSNGDLLELSAGLPSWQTPSSPTIITTDITDSGSAGRSTVQLPTMLQVRDGLSYGSYDYLRCYVNPGVISHGDGSRLASVPYELTCDIRVVGVATGSPVAGSSPYIGGWMESPGYGSFPVDTAPIFFYFIRKTAAPNEGELAFVCSTFDTASGIVPYMPVGWEYFSAAQHCIIWHTGRGSHWQGFPDFFNPPRTSKMIMTGSGESSDYRFLTTGDSGGTWATIGLTLFCADGARDPIIFGKVSLAAAGTEGGAWIRPNSTTGGGYPIGYLTPHATIAGVAYSSDIWCKTDSGRAIQYLTTGDVKLDLFYKGHHFSEPR